MAATRYSEEQWETPKPDDSWSEAEALAWEDRNPTWMLMDDLRVDHMDSDFIETIFGPDKIDYLETQLKLPVDRERMRSEIPADADTLVLIMSVAFDGKKVRLTSTPSLHYHGEYLWNL